VAILKSFSNYYKLAGWSGAWYSFATNYWYAFRIRIFT